MKLHTISQSFCFTLRLNIIDKLESFSEMSKIFSRSIFMFNYWEVPPVMSVTGTKGWQQFNHILLL